MVGNKKISREEYKNIIIEYSKNKNFAKKERWLMIGIVIMAVSIITYVISFAGIYPVTENTGKFQDFLTYILYMNYIICILIPLIIFYLALKIAIIEKPIKITILIFLIVTIICTLLLFVSSNKLPVFELVHLERWGYYELKFDWSSILRKFGLSIVVIIMLLNKKMFALFLKYKNCKNLFGGRVEYLIIILDTILWLLIGLFILKNIFEDRIDILFIKYIFVAIYNIFTTLSILKSIYILRVTDTVNRELEMKNIELEMA